MSDSEGSGVRLVGVDVGGTFTDLVGVDDAGRVSILKVPSTPSDQAKGVLAGIRQMCGTAKHLERIVHGSTVATNALLEERGAKVALLTTRGFRDTIEIGRCRRMTGNIFDIRYVKPAPLVLRRLRFEITERMRQSGEVIVPLDTDELDAVADALAAEKVGAVAICFLHSYANADHERQAKTFLARRLPNVMICTSAEILPEYLEYERFSTTVTNAYIGPLMQRYIGSLAEDLRSVGYRRDVYTMASNGGIMNTATTSRFPVRTILSGLAGGVSGALFVARAAGVSNLVTYDMGGTSTDVCLLDNLTPIVANESIVAGRVVKTPQIEVHTVGTGGGSLAWIDIDGSLKVGPRSAGAVPGPACYGRGGTDATITDANLLLGRLSANSLLGGQMPLVPALAEKAMTALASRLSSETNVEWLAEGVIRLAVTKMAAAIRKISVARGYDPREFTLVALGGAGPMHAVQVAEEVGMREIMIPLWPGNLSALGLLAADLRHDFVRTYLTPLDRADPALMDTIYAEMAQEGTSALREEGLDGSSINIARFADLRFSGQAYDLTVPVPNSWTKEQLLESFHQAYLRRYGHDQDEPVELVNLRVVARGLTPKPALPDMPTQHGKRAETHRRVYFDRKWQEAQVVARGDLRVGEQLAGPGIVEEFGATTVIPPGWIAHVEDRGVIFVRSSETPAARGGN